MIFVLLNVLQAVNLGSKAAIINKNILNHYCVVSVLLDKENKVLSVYGG